MTPIKTQIDILDEIIVDNFPEWNIGKLVTMAQFHDAVAV